MDFKLDIQAFHDGDTTELEKVYKNCYKALYREACAHLLGFDADLAIQDVFIKLIESPETRQKFKGGCIEAWLTIMVRNRARVLRRKVLQIQENEIVDDVDCGLGGDGCEERLLFLSALNRFLETIPERHHDLIRLLFLEDYPLSEVARKLGKKRTSLYYWKVIYTRKLRAFLVRDRRGV